MQQYNSHQMRFMQLDRYEGYKVFISVFMGLLGFTGAFYSIQFNYGHVKINIIWSLIFPLLVALVWGRSYGCISIMFGLTVLYPFYLSRYNGWACLVPAFSLFLWIMIQGYGSEKRLQGGKFYSNIYFLQFIYIMIHVTLYFAAFSFLYQFNPPFWYPDASTTIDYETIFIYAIKSVVMESILLAVCDVLLLLPFIRKIFRLEYSKAARYNTGIVLFVVALGLLFASIILTSNYFIIDGQCSFQWRQFPPAKVLLIIFLTSALYTIVGGIIARIFQQQLKTEEVLKVSEAKYRSIFENINDLYIESTLDGTILTISPSVKKFLGYAVEDLVGTNIADLYYEPDQRKQLIEALLQEKEINNYTISMKGKSGHQHYLWINLKVVDYGNGDRRTIGVARDVTQYMEARAKQEESETKYKLLFDKMMNGLLVLEPIYNDENKMTDVLLVDANPGFERLTGLIAADTLGKTWFDVFGYKNRYLSDYQRVLQSGEYFQFENYNLLLKQYYMTGIFKINDNRIGGVFENITERKKAEEEVKGLAANLIAIFESTKDNIWLVNENYQLITCNQAFINSMKKLMGATVKPGTKAEETISKELAEVWEGYYSKALKEGQFTVEETVGAIVLEASFNPICKDGKAAGVAVFCKNITARKSAEQEIVKLNAELEQRVMERTTELQKVVSELEAFTYTVSHDLKSPLRVIDGYNRIILEDHEKDLDGDVVEMVWNVRKLCSDMIAMINKLLQYSTTSRQTIYKKAVNIDEIFRMIFHDLQSAYPERKMELAMEKQLPGVMADEILLKQVIYNILSNAIKFTKAREKALVTVGCLATEEEHIFYVKDNGVGFDMEYSGKLFGVFQRLHSPKEYEGSGIGLATIRKIIQKHGGRTWIEGKVDEGAAVYFTLPIY